jgi:hypothetical protein
MSRGVSQPCLPVLSAGYCPEQNSRIQSFIVRVLGWRDRFAASHPTAKPKRTGPSLLWRKSLFMIARR